MTETIIKADSLFELTEIVNNINKLGEEWCRKHDDYNFKINIDNKKLRVNVSFEKAQ